MVMTDSAFLKCIVYWKNKEHFQRRVTDKNPALLSPICHNFTQIRCSLVDVRMLQLKNSVVIIKLEIRVVGQAYTMLAI